MAAATVDARVTVTQHGFHVKQPLQQPSVGGAAEAPRPDAERELGAGAPPLPAQRREEGCARGLLSFTAIPPVTVQPCAPPPGSGCLQPAEHAHLTPGVKRLMKSVVRGLKALQEPEAASEGLGGTYFFSNEAGQKIAIMKPCDEEPLAPNNPKGFVGRQLGEPGLKPTVRVGEAASREVRGRVCCCWGRAAGAGSALLAAAACCLQAGLQRPTRAPPSILARTPPGCCRCKHALLAFWRGRRLAAPDPLTPPSPSSRWLHTCWTTTALPACPTP